MSGPRVHSVGMYGNVIRVAPPLVITKAEIDESVAILDKVLTKLRRQVPPFEKETVTPQWREARRGPSVHWRR